MTTSLHTDRVGSLAWVCLAILSFPLASPGRRRADSISQTARGDQVDVYHGVKVADPYRWLEADIRTRRRWPIGWRRKTSSPPLPGGDPPAGSNSPPVDRAVELRPIFLAHEGGRPILLPQERRPPEPGRPVRDGLARRPAAGAVGSRTSGRRTARSPWPGMGFSDDGSTWPTPAPRPAPIGRPGTSWRSPHEQSLPDELKWTKFSDASWTKDGKGFFYTRYDEPRAAPSSRPSTSTTSSTTTASARRNRPTCWSIGGRTIPSGYTTARSRTTAAIW